MLLEFSYSKLHLRKKGADQKRLAPYTLKYFLNVRFNGLDTYTTLEFGTGLVVNSQVTALSDLI